MPSMSRIPSAAGPAPPFNKRPRSDTPFTRYELLQVSYAASCAVEEAGYQCYLFGSAAVYFTCPDHRKPRDIDLVVFSTSPTAQKINAEQVKIAIRREDSRFYRVRAKSPGAKYTPFWFWFSDDPQAPDFTHSIKVDVVPFDIKDFRVPQVPVQSLVRRTVFRWRGHEHGFWLVPPPALLIMKLKGWHDHRLSSKHWIREKTPTDIVDIQALLTVVENGQHTLTSHQQSWFPVWLIRQGRERAREFLDNNPDISHSHFQAQRWINVGLIDASYHQTVEANRHEATVLARWVRQWITEDD
ncbi:hypothetical protein AAF712_010541 [Marasmius tenuissimus]|uniref:Nucleotidyltransferase n=1 Tax=Marasmius tenuissimus TaxID=585030 RepID=A0ABR2ZQE7_9AGAR